MGEKRYAGVLLVLALFAGATATGASASPSFYECAKVEGGKYADKACTVGAPPGRYEPKPGTGSKGKPFKVKATGLAIHIPSIGAEMTCAKSKGVLTLTSTTTVLGALTSSKCQAAGKSCSGPGAKPGVIEAELEGEVGTLEKPLGPSKMPFAAGDGIEGVQTGLKKKNGNGEPLPPLKYKCSEGLEAVEVEVRGLAIGEVTEDVGKFSKSFNWIFALNEEGLQKWQAFEGGPPEQLEATVVGLGTFPASVSLNAAGKGEMLDLKP